MDSSGRRQRFKLGIDIGGTFTDIVMLDKSSGEVYNGKLVSTPQDLSRGVIAIFERMLFSIECKTGIRGNATASHWIKYKISLLCEVKEAVGH